MSHALQTREERQRRILRVVHAPHFEHVEGADANAVRLTLTAFAIDDRRVDTGLGVTLV